MSLSGVTYDPGPTTLGAYRRAKRLCTWPAITVTYWLPCYRLNYIGEDGRAQPHAWFITSNQDPHVLCPTCRAERAAGVVAKPADPF